MEVRSRAGQHRGARKIGWLPSELRERKAPKCSNEMNSSFVKDVKRNEPWTETSYMMMWGWSWFKVISEWKTSCASDQKHPALDSHGRFHNHTHTKKKKEVSVVSLCTSEDKQTYLYPDSLLPLSPISGCIFCYIMREVLNKASQWKSSSRSNQRRGSMYHRLAGRKGQ